LSGLAPSGSSKGRAGGPDQVSGGLAPLTEDTERLLLKIESCLSLLVTRDANGEARGLSETRPRGTRSSALALALVVPMLTSKRAVGGRQLSQLNL
jgi:hypothetical protein